MIRLFISSTFQDMSEERELIHREIYPKLRSYGLSKGVPVDICDLRWGVDISSDESEAEMMGKVMEVCFREVEKCDPYIIAMIGGRYGTVTDKEVTERVLNLWNTMDRGPDMPPPDRKLSLTQWELEYSFLSRKNPDVRALCMFKKISKKECKAIGDLKSRILEKEKSVPDAVKTESYYEKGNLEDFCEKIEKRVTAFIDEKCKEDSQENPAKREYAIADAYSEIKMTEFGGREKELQICRDFISDKDKTVLGVYGSSGSGKSTLIAKVYRETLERFKAEEGIKCRLINCGASEYSDDYVNLLKQIVFALNECVYGTEAKYREELASKEKAEAALEGAMAVVNESEDAKELLLFIDAMDKVNAPFWRTEENLILRLLLGNNNSNHKVRLVCSQINAFDSVGREGMECLEIGRLNESEIKEVLRRKLFSDQQDVNIDNNPMVMEILKKGDVGEPLYLDAATSFLKMHMADPNAKGNQHYIDEIKKFPEKTRKMCWHVIRNAISYLELDEKRMMDGIALIAGSRYGMREDDLEKIENTEWRPLEFSRLCSYLNSFFRYQSSGFWVFEHDIIAEGVRQGLSDNGRIFEKKKSLLYEYLLGKNCWDYELIARESMLLNMCYHDYSSAGIFFWKMIDLDGEDRFKVWETMANEIDLITQSDEGEQWYREVARRNENVLAKMLRGMLELYGSEDYPRQYPAKKVTDLFWKTLELDVRADSENDTIFRGQNCLAEWYKNRSFDERFALSLFITEYVNICESLGEHMLVASCVAHTLSFFLSDNNIKQMDEEQKKKAFKSVNSLFFTNNKIINKLIATSSNDEAVLQLRGLSENVMTGFDADIFHVRSETKKEWERALRKLEGMYTSNKGQYYNAVHEYEKALWYHLESLNSKAGVLLDLCGEQWGKKEFGNLCDINCDSSSVDRIREFLLKIDIEKHRSFWKKIEDELKNKDEDLRRDLTEEWKAIGVGYRNLGWDIFRDYNRNTENNTDHKVENEKLLDLACACMELSITMVCGDAITITVREQVVSRIRNIALQVKRDKKTPREMQKILKDALIVIEQYSKNAQYLGKEEGNNLKNNLNTLMESIKKDQMKGLHDVEKVREEKKKLEHLMEISFVAG